MINNRTDYQPKVFNQLDYIRCQIEGKLQQYLFEPINDELLDSIKQTVAQEIKETITQQIEPEFEVVTNVNEKNEVIITVDEKLEFIIKPNYNLP